MPIFMCGTIVVQIFLQDRVDTTEKTIVVLDGTGRMLAPLQALTQLRNGEGEAENGKKARRTVKIEAGPAGPVTEHMRLELSERIRRDEIFAFLEIDADALKSSNNSHYCNCCAKIGTINPPAKSASSDEIPADDSTADKQPPESSVAKSNDEKPDSGHDVPVRLYTQNITYNEIGQWLMQSVNQAAFALRLEDARLNPAAVAAAACPSIIRNLDHSPAAAAGKFAKGIRARAD